MTQYATESEFSDLGLPTEATKNMTSGQINAALKVASRFADSYLAKRYTVPLETYGEDIKRCVIDIAQFDIMARRGFRPGSGADEIIIKRRDDAVDWLRQVAKKLVEPTGITETRPEIATPIVTTDRRVNWDWQTRRD